VDRYAALLERYNWRERRADARAALIAKWIANMLGEREEGAEPLELDDFMVELMLLPTRPEWMKEVSEEDRVKAEQQHKQRVTASLLRAVTDGS
jgi:hypothetical protein